MPSCNMDPGHSSHHYENISGLALSSDQYKNRGWHYQHLWGLNIDREVLTTLLMERFGPNGYALDLIENDLYKIWAPAEISSV